MIDARKEEDTPLTDEQREQLAGIMDKCESIIRRLESINELVRGDLWDPVRHFRENPIPKHMERILWFRHREDRLSDPQKAFLDRIFKRLEAPDGRYWRWRMQRPPE
jgi:hypothetical protein